MFPLKESGWTKSYYVHAIYLFYLLANFFLLIGIFCMLAEPALKYT